MTLSFFLPRIWVFGQPRMDRNTLANLHADFCEGGSDSDVVVALDSGCDLVQGYYMVRPAAVQPDSDQQIIDMLKNNTNLKTD